MRSKEEGEETLRFTDREREREELTEIADRQTDRQTDRRTDRLAEGEDLSSNNLIGKFLNHIRLCNRLPTKLF